MAIEVWISNKGMHNLLLYSYPIKIIFLAFILAKSLCTQ